MAYPAQSARDEINRLLTDAQNATNEEDKKDIYRMIVDTLENKIAHLANLKLKIIKANSKGEESFYDTITDMDIPPYGLTFKDALDQVNAMFDANLLLLKDISLHYVNLSCQQESRGRNLYRTAALPSPGLIPSPGPSMSRSPPRSARSPPRSTRSPPRSTRSPPRSARSLLQSARSLPEF